MHRYVYRTQQAIYEKVEALELYNPDVSRRCQTKRKRRLKKPHCSRIS